MTAEENIAFQNGMIVGMVQKGVLVAEGGGKEKELIQMGGISALNIDTESKIAINPNFMMVMSEMEEI